METRFDDADRILKTALELTAADRAAFLDRECGGDRELRALVERLLQHAELTHPGLATGGGLGEPGRARDLIGSDLTGTSLDRYRIAREIGRGGMGVVYEAHDDRLRRSVAIKVLGAVQLDPQARARFLREARAAAALNHPNIVALYDAGEASGHPYLVMEYVPGRSLEEEAPASPDEAVLAARLVCDALEHAHGRGLVHRDLKPGNILGIREGGSLRIKLTDMGIALSTGAASLTRTGAIAGTPAYMAPEQILGHHLDGRADLYSLGVMLYRWVTGRLPFEGTNPLSVVSQHLHAPVPAPRTLAPELPPGLDEVIVRLLAKDAGDRYPDAVSTRAALEEATGTGGGAASARTVSAERRARPGAIGSIAVLPFAQRDRDPDAEYLVEGLTESLIDRLSRIPRLRVLAHTTVLPFSGRETPQEIGEQLGVRAVVAGRVRTRGAAMNVEVELVDTHDGARLWGNRYRRSKEELLGLESEITNEVTASLELRLADSERRRFHRRTTDDPEAQQAYLKGRHVWSRWKTPEGMKTAIGWFERALELDPLHARAFAGLADSYSVLGNVKALAPGEAYPKAKTAAEQGLAIDDSLAELHTSLGFIRRMWEWDWEGAEESYRRAIDLNPGYATAHRWYSHLLAGLGRHDEALPVAWRGLENDPLSLLIKGSVGDVLFYARRYEEAISLYRETLAVDPQFLPGHTDLARALELAGRYEEAIAEFRAAAALVTKGPPEPSSGLAHVYARMGRRDDAMKIVGELLEMGRTRYVSPYGIASIHACLGENDAALDWLEKAWEQHDQTLVWVKVHPRLDGLQEEPRYRRLLEHMKLA